MKALKNIIRGVVVSLLLLTGEAHALTPAQMIELTTGDNDQRIEAISRTTAAGDSAAIPFLNHILNDEIRISDNTIFIVSDSGVINAFTGHSAELPDYADDVTNNNRMRSSIEAAIAALNLLANDADVRHQAAVTLQQTENDESILLLVRKVEKAEQNAKTRLLLSEVRARIELRGDDRLLRLNAAQELASGTSTEIKNLLNRRLIDDADNGETDPEVRQVITAAIHSIDQRLAYYEHAGTLFTGISLGSVLLLAALGLAITYGLMGVINMAHGEMIMLGAYATYIVQNIFRQYLPGLFDAYILLAIPVAFITTALIGMVMERTVIRHLYGRPLETLLATWGISLILMQLVRTLFGAQNVMVENPSWMSGGLELSSNLVLPYNRITIILFSFSVLLLVWSLLNKSRLGLFVRAVTQNRTMAGCVGVNTKRIDSWAFALGSGTAGLAGVALAQIGNVGPDLGQTYIVDSFLVVVLGGVGQLAGTVYAALGIGIVSKSLEGFSGAVLAKIIVLIAIIIFIQKRPQGIFALKGRSVE